MLLRFRTFLAQGVFIELFIDRVYLSMNSQNMNKILNSIYKERKKYTKQFDLQIEE
jgi:hypothetical protein